MTDSIDLSPLGETSRRLAKSVERLDLSLVQVDRALRTRFGANHFVSPRPLCEYETRNERGVRVIELYFLGFLEIDGVSQLAVKSVKVMDSKWALNSEVPTTLLPLLQVAPELRHKAAEALPGLLKGLEDELKRQCETAERRCEIAAKALASVSDTESPQPKPDVEEPMASVDAPSGEAPKARLGWIPAKEMDGTSKQPELPGRQTRRTWKPGSAPGGAFATGDSRGGRSELGH